MNDAVFTLKAVNLDPNAIQKPYVGLIWFSFFHRFMFVLE